MSDTTPDAPHDSITDIHELVGIDGELIEPIPIPHRTIPIAWFLLPILLGLASAYALLRLQEHSDNQTRQDMIQYVQNITFPPPATIIVKGPDTASTYPEIVPPGTISHPLSVDNASQIKLLHFMPIPIDTLHFSTDWRVDMISGSTFLSRSTGSTYMSKIDITTDFSPPFAFSTDASIMATGSLEQRILLWDTARRIVDLALPPMSAEVTALTFSGNGMLLAGGDATGEIMIWNVFTNEELTRLQVGGIIQQMSFDRSGTHLAVTSAGAPLRVYTNWQLSDEITTSGPVDAHIISGDGKFLLYGDNQDIVVYSLAEHTVHRILRKHAYTVTALRFTADETLIASGDSYGEIILWEMASGIPLTSLSSTPPHGIRALEVNSYNGKSMLLATTHDQGHTSFWGVVEQR